MPEVRRPGNGPGGIEAHLFCGRVRGESRQGRDDGGEAEPDEQWAVVTDLAIPPADGLDPTIY